jgi:hypothetical protein
MEQTIDKNDSCLNRSYQKHSGAEADESDEKSSKLDWIHLVVSKN